MTTEPDWLDQKIELEHVVEKLKRHIGELETTLKVFKEALEEICDGEGCSHGFGGGCDSQCERIARGALIDTGHYD